ncbi:MAG: putative Peptidase U62 modulator of DNA gyrase [Promethearchaeota archaeon]|nr:MAG: putative Peptidase U62 modulator of DNA gyrase [Candidatus Lokiarchaeota archaeon]
MKDYEKLELIEKVIKSKGISDYEIYLIESEIYEIEFRNAKVASERQVNDLDYFIRLLDQKDETSGMGIAKGNKLEENRISQMVDNCIKLSQINESSDYSFPSPQSYSEIQPNSNEVLKNPSIVIQKLTDKIKRKLSEFKKTTPTFGRIRIHIDHKFLNNSTGLNLDTKRSYFYLEFAIKAKQDKKLSEFWDVDYIRSFSDVKIEQRLDKWNKFALASINAVKPKSNNNAIVIFSPSLLKDALIPVIGFHASGKASYEEQSFFKRSEKVADSKIKIIDNGLLDGGLRTSPWDGEGNPQKRTVIINNGIFENRLYDQKYAILEKTQSTGNGIRTSNGTIENTVTNMEILPGKLSLNEIISNIKEGYLIQKCSWLNPDKYSGFFGTEIRNGNYIKDGALGTPIKGGNLSGNVLDMIKNCEYISKEREFSGNSYLPYIAFSKLNVSS